MARLQSGNLMESEDDKKESQQVGIEIIRKINATKLSLNAKHFEA